MSMRYESDDSEDGSNIDDEWFRMIIGIMISEGDSDLAQSLGTYVDKIKAGRDTAHREALARVEAERDAVRSAMRRQSERHDELLSTLELVTNQRDATQAQLAEAVGLLRFDYNQDERQPNDDALHEQKVRAFLARHAQAEQQEAHSVQVEYAAPHQIADAIESLEWKGCSIGHKVVLENAVAALRAALATQPATKVECPDRALKNALFACVNAGGKPRTYGGVLTAGGYAWVRFTVEPAVRGAEHDQ
jgi:hypothetical protein